MESQTIKNSITQQQLLNDFLVVENCKIEADVEQTLNEKLEQIDINKKVNIQCTKEKTEKKNSPQVRINTKSRSNTSGQNRPEYSYVALIYCALKQAPDRRLQLADIYNWIAKNYPYYGRSESKAWQNSIRHNLSLNDCFKKVPREIAKTGEKKGNYWYLVPEADDMFKDGSWKRRKNTRKGAKTSKKNSQPINEALANYANYANFSSLSAAPNVSLVPSAPNYYFNSVSSTRPYYATPYMHSSSTENIDYIYNPMPQHSSAFSSQFVGTQGYYDSSSYSTSSGDQRATAQQLQHSSQSMQQLYCNPLNFYVNGSASTSTQPSEESRSPQSQPNAQSACNAYNNLSSAQSTASRIDYSTVAQEYASSNYCPIENNTYYPYPSLYASL